MVLRADTQTVDVWLECAILTKPLTEEQGALLKEGEHFVVCKLCSAKLLSLSTPHLQKCCNKDVSWYQGEYPTAQIMSSLTRERKVKTQAQKEAQSEKLKARFQTEAGEKTREQIRAASLARLSDPKQYDIAVNHLRKMRKLRALEQEKRKTLKWRLSNVYRAWHKANPEKSKALIAQARLNIKQKTTKPHLALKDAMVEAGLPPSKAEFAIHYYCIDEAYPEYKLAIEMDGCYWHGCESCGFSPQPRNKVCDKKKTTYLTKRNWSIVRIPEHMVKKDMAEAIRVIRAALVEAGHVFND